MMQLTSLGKTTQMMVWTTDPEPWAESGRWTAGLLWTGFPSSELRPDSGGKMRWCSARRRLEVPTTTDGAEEIAVESVAFESVWEGRACDEDCGVAVTVVVAVAPPRSRGGTSPSAQGGPV